MAHDEQTPRTLHTTFAAQVAHGPLEIDVEVLRAGRSMSQLRAEVRNPGTERGHLTTCVFGAPRAGFDFTDLRPPEEIPDPAGCPSFRDPPPGGDARLRADAVLGRTGRGPVRPRPCAVGRRYVPDRAERVMWYRFDDSPVARRAVSIPWP